MFEFIKEISKNIQRYYKFILIAIIYQVIFVFVIKTIYDFIKTTAIDKLILVDEIVLLNYDLFYNSILSINGVITIILVLLAASLFLIQNLGLIFILSDIYSNKTISLISAFKRSLKKLKITTITFLIKHFVLASVLILPAVILYFLYVRSYFVLFYIFLPILVIVSLYLFFYIYTRTIFLQQILCLENRKIKDVFNDHLTKKRFFKLFKIGSLFVVIVFSFNIILTTIFLLFKDLIIKILINNTFLLSIFLSLWIILATIVLPLVGFVYNAIFVEITTYYYYKYSNIKTNIDFNVNSKMPLRKVNNIIKKYRWWLSIIVIIYIISNIFFIYPLVNQEINNIDKDIEITAHRGYSSIAPENTIAAFSKAIEAKADYIELDVRQTKDGVLVVFHDESLKRIASINKKVWDLNYSSLKKIDVGSHFSKEYSDQRIPTFKEVIDLAKNKTKLIIDVKTSSFDEDKNLSQKIVKQIVDNDIILDSIVISTDYELLKKIRVLNEDIKVGLVMGTYLGNYSDLDVDIYIISAPIVGTQNFMQNVRSKNKKVFVYPAFKMWSLNPLENVSKFIDYGVDNLIVSDIAKTRSVLEKMNNRSTLKKINAKIKSYFS